MAKFKPAKGKAQPASARGAIPCLILIVSGMLLVALLFYMFLRSNQ